MPAEKAPYLKEEPINDGQREEPKNIGRVNDEDLAHELAKLQNSNQNESVFTFEQDKLVRTARENLKIQDRLEREFLPDATKLIETLPLDLQKDKDFTRLHYRDTNKLIGFQYSIISTLPYPREDLPQQRRLGGKELEEILKRFRIDLKDFEFGKLGVVGEPSGVRMNGSFGSNNLNLTIGNLHINLGLKNRFEEVGNARFKTKAQLLDNITNIDVFRFSITSI